MPRMTRREMRLAWRVRRFHESPMTVAEFCDAEQVSVTNFYAWRKKLRENQDDSNDKYSERRQGFAREGGVSSGQRRGASSGCPDIVAGRCYPRIGSRFVEGAIATSDHGDGASDGGINGRPTSERRQIEQAEARMLNLAANTRILVYSQPTDMRNYAVLGIMPSPQRSRRVHWGFQAF